jgi:hypothetical protein
MLIRSEQQQEMGKCERTRFEERAFDYLAPRLRRRRTPEADEELRQAIVRGIDDARPLRITREVDVIRYLELTLGLGPVRLAEPRFQWIDDYLNEQIPAEERIDLIAERLRFDAELRR